MSSDFTQTQRNLLNNVKHEINDKHAGRSVAALAEAGIEKALAIA